MSTRTPAVRRKAHSIGDLLSWSPQAPMTHVERGPLPTLIGIGNSDVHAEAAALNAKAAALNAKAREKLPCPVNSAKKYVDGLQWGPLHKSGDADAIDERHRDRSKLYSWIAARLAYPEDPLILGEEMDKLSDGSSVPLIDYQFDWQGEGTVSVRIFGGAVMIAKGFQSTRTLQSDIDTSMEAAPSISKTGLKHLADRFVEAVDDVQAPLGLLFDTNFYLGTPVMNERTRAVSPLDLVVAELMSDVESPALLMDSARSLYLKAAVQLNLPMPTAMAVVPTGRKYSTFYDAEGTQDILKRVKAWYSFQAGFDHSDGEPPSNLLARKALTEKAIYEQQFDFGIKARELTIAALAEADDAEQQAKAADLLYVYTILGLLKLEGYVSPFSASLVVLQAPSRSLSSKALLTAQAEQLLDGLVKTLTAPDSSVGKHTTMKPKVIARLAAGLFESRAAVVDNELVKSIEALIKEGRRKLAAAEGAEGVSDEEKKRRVANATRLLDYYSAKSLTALQSDFTDGTGVCKSRTCTLLKEAAGKIGLVDISQDTLVEGYATLLNAQSADLLLKVLVSLANELGFAASLCEVQGEIVAKIGLLKAKTDRYLENKVAQEKIDEMSVRLAKLGLAPDEKNASSLGVLSEYLVGLLEKKES